MKKLLCLMGGVMLMMNLCAQRRIDRFIIGEDIPDLPLTRIINYKDSVASLTSFGEKLIILDFWGLHCGPCIEAFPKMDSIQRVLKDKVQFILVTLDPKEKVEPFLKKWNAQHEKPLTIPIIYGEIAIQLLFAHSGIPHLVFISPLGGRLLLQSSDKALLNLALIDSMATESLKRIGKIEARGWPESTYKFSTANAALLKRLKENRWPD